jgi:hypothetical protein
MKKMRNNLISELSEIWRKAENCLADQDDKKALDLKAKFEMKFKKYNLTADEIEALSLEIESMGG